MTPRTLTVLLAACGLLSLAQARPITDVDLFWQLDLGARMLATGGLVTADPYSSTHFGEPVPPLSWLAQILAALVVRAGGLPLLHALDSLLFAIAFALVAWRLARPAGPFALALSFALAAWVAVPWNSVRPQTFALFGFALLMVLEASARPLWAKALQTLALVTLWQNLHPSGASAVALLGARGVERVADSRILRAALPNELLIILALFGCCLTPQGFGVWETTRVNADIARFIGVSEWLPAWHPDVTRVALPFWVSLAASLVLLLKIRRRATAGDVARLLIWAAFAVLVVRLALFYTLVMLPVWARWLTLANVGATEPRRDRVAAGPAIALAALGVALILPTLLGVPTVSPSLPLNGVAALKRERVDGPVYTFREWGGPLIGAGFRVTIDGRLYLYPKGDWRAYHREAAGDESLAAVVARYRPAAFLLFPGAHERLQGELRASPEWREVHADGASVAFVRSDGD